MGTAHLLFPPGIEDIRDLPATHFDLIRRSMIYLGFEEMPQEDRPPRKIWLDDKRLVEHFDRLKEKRKAEAGGDSVPSEPMQENSLAKEMIVG